MSYIEYDELGVVEIRCMNCGVPIVMRSYKTVTIRSIPPKEVNVMTLVPLNSFCKKKYNIGTHGYVEVMLCSDCINLPSNPGKMEKAIGEGWLTVWKHDKKTEKEIKELKKSLPILSGSEKDRLRREKKYGL